MPNTRSIKEVRHEMDVLEEKDIMPLEIQIVQLEEDKFAAQERFTKAQRSGDKSQMAKEDRALTEIAIELKKLQEKRRPLMTRYNELQAQLTGRQPVAA